MITWPLFRRRLLWATGRAALSLALVAALFLPTHGQVSVRLTGETTRLGLNNIAVYLDSTRKDDFESVRGKAFSTPETASPSVWSEAFWLRVALSPPPPNDAVLELQDIFAGMLDVYVRDATGKWRSYRGGLMRPFSERPLARRLPVFPVGGADSVYIRMVTVSPPILKLTLYTPLGFEKKEARETAFHAFVYGALALIFFYNLFLGITMKEGLYFVYVVMIALMAHNFGNVWGYTTTRLWPWLGNWAAPWTMGLVFVSMFTVVEFTKRYLSVKEYSRRGYRILHWVQAIIALGALWGWCLPLFPPELRPYWSRFLMSNTLVIPPAMMLLAAWLYRKGNPAAPSYMAAFGALVGGSLLLSLKNFGVLPSNLLTENGLIIGSVMEGAILAVGLGHKINRLNREREEAQARTIAALQENERLIVEQNRTLEQKVRERTDDLRLANEELNSTNEELNATLEHVTRQNHVIEKKNEDILESIRYALRIQTAILPEDGYIRHTLNDFFAFYRPRDVVSGDFYWYGYLEREGVAAVAAVDCTGHGVPGAFMSVVGYNQLNRAILEMRMTDPARVLAELDLRIRQTLKQDEGSGRYDGMDLALCVWFTHENRLLFAGAQRPLYYFDSDGQFRSIPGDKFPVGGAQAVEKSFTTHEIALTGAEKCYLFTDGYTDQFGGPNKRKFTPKRLQELLGQIHALPFDEQGRRVARVFDDWKGDVEQLDDVSVLGFRPTKG